MMKPGTGQVGGGADGRGTRLAKKALTLALPLALFAAPSLASIPKDTSGKSISVETGRFSAERNPQEVFCR